MKKKKSDSLVRSVRVSALQASRRVMLEKDKMLKKFTIPQTVLLEPRFSGIVCVISV